MSIDYALAKRLVTKHRRALTVAKSKGPREVVDAVTAFYADFVDNDLPLPDAWHTWNVAYSDAIAALRREAWA